MHHDPIAYQADVHALSDSHLFLPVSDDIYGMTN